MNYSKYFHGPSHASAGRFAWAALLAAIVTVGSNGTANAAQCLNEAFGGDTSCVSNDIKIASISVTNVDEACDGSPGDTFTFSGNLNIQSSAQNRYDLGFYVGTNPETSTNDDCSVAIIPPSVGDLDGDACGDVASNAAFAVPVSGITAPCQDSDNNGFFDVNACSAWDVNSSDTCNGPEDAVPSSSPKCKCDVVPTDEPVPNCNTDSTLCEDNNACTNDICNPVGSGLGDQFNCSHTFNNNPCSDGLFCNGTDFCSVGSCVGHNGDPCVNGGVCGDLCNETTDSCFDPAGTVCRVSAGICDTQETCTGSSGACPNDQFQSGNTCRGSAGVCDVAETCSGSSASCPGDSFATNATACRASGGVCDVVENCTGQGPSCPADGFVSSATTCRSSGGICDVAENCTGQGPTCPGDSFVSSAVTCRASGGVCDVSENCTGASATCPADSFVSGSTTCRESGGVCDVAENCTGASATCPDNGFVSSAAICRGSGGVCDIAEHCTGAGASCPGDVFTSNATTCRASGGVCDVAENCTGAGATCPADTLVTNGTVCRADAGDCDVAETCTGASATCPGNAFEPAGTDCAADTNPCTDDECNGSGVCEHGGNASNCDDGLFCNGDDTCVNGQCTGHSGDPCADGGVCGDNCQEATDSCFDSASTVCRPSGGICDVAENCTGTSGDCPANVLVSSATTCRASGGVCDIAEHCTGSTGSCPANAFVANSTTCRPSTGVCDVAENCSGNSATCPNDAFLPNSTVCRSDAGDCDIAEHCTGAAGACPAQAFEPNGTVCTTDNDVCTDDKCNANGSCQHTNNTAPCDDGLFCTVNDKCAGGDCGGTPRQCGDEQQCTIDTCNEAQDRCDNDPDNERCGDDDICTTDVCDVELGCRHIPSCKDICRRFGFFAKRGGSENDGPNVVQLILDAVGGLEVCGQSITETSLGEGVDDFGLTSALEGICVRASGNDERKLYRELVTTALNCAMSGTQGNEDLCDGVIGKFVDVTFSECSALCETGADLTGEQDSEPLIDACITQLSCYNSGGQLIAGRCALGECDKTHEPCGAQFGQCPPITIVTTSILQVCERFQPNCRNEPFCQEGLGICPDRMPSTSGHACRAARSNECTIDSCPPGSTSNSD